MLPWACPAGYSPARAGACKFSALIAAFISSAFHEGTMYLRIPVFALLCAAAVILAGCASPNSGPVTPTPAASVPTTVTTLPATSVPPVTLQSAECTGAADCIPAECCHPTACIAGPRKTPCTIMCTMVCSGPLDCGAGSCGCIDGRCAVIPASRASGSPDLSIGIVASPPRYSPLMSSTPGIGLEAVVTGSVPKNTTYTWNASYGHFLSWSSPDFRVNELGNTVTNHGEEIYWTFTDRPASTAVPVTITVLVSEPGTGRVLAGGALDLAWDGNFTVVARG